MNTKQIVVAAVLLISLVVNGILVHERLEKKFYQNGFADGVKQMGDKIVSEIQKNQALTVKMPDGKQVMLGTVEAVKKQLVAQEQKLQLTPKPQEAPIDALQGTIDKPVAQTPSKPQEVNKP